MRSREEDSLVGRAAFRARFVADSAKQEARLPTNLVPRACVRHSLLPCEQGKRKKTCPRPDRSLGHDRGTDRNRRASASLSPVLIHFLAPHGKLYQRLFTLEQVLGSIPPLISEQQHPGPREPQHSIPSEEWPQVVRRVREHHEPLRQVAADYGVSHETVRRILRTSRNHRAG